MVSVKIETCHIETIYIHQLFTILISPGFCYNDDRKLMMQPAYQITYLIIIFNQTASIKAALSL